MTTVETMNSTKDPVLSAARSVGRAIALAVGYRLGIDKDAIETARTYAVTAGDSLGEDVRACLMYGNAVAAEFDSMIRDMAVSAVLKTFGAWAGRERLELVSVEARRGTLRGGSGSVAAGRRSTRERRSDRRVWTGRLG